MSLPVAKLSCEQCRLRKVKCNKAVPCSACVAANIQCVAVQRYRKPRGRSGKQHESSSGASGKNRTMLKRDMTERIAQLEAVVEQLRDRDNATDLTSPPINATSTTSLESLLAPSFWTELSEAFTDIKGVLESEPDVTPEAIHYDDLDGQDIASATSPSDPLSIDISDAHNLLFSCSQSIASPSSTHSGELGKWLLEIYKDRVHAIFRPLYLPVVLPWLRSRETSAQDVQLEDGAIALNSAIDFAAICTLSKNELQKRRLLVEQSKAAAEKALSQAGLLTTTDFVVLQAFVLYLAGLRAHQANAQQWALIALAIRLANAQNIPTCLSVMPSSPETESKRRLWVSIGMLDLQSSFDRGSRPLLSANDLQLLHSRSYDSALTPPLNDKQFMDFCEMTFVLTTHRAGICQRRLTEIGTAASFTADAGKHFAMAREQVTVLEEFQANVQQLMGLYGVRRSPIQSFTIAVAEEAMITMRMLLHRPLYRSKYKLPYDAIAGFRKINAFEAALEILERSQQKRTQHDYLRWAWFSWPKWYALAIVLAEFCSVRGRPPGGAWDVVTRSFEDYAEIVADSKTGLLWKPILKLMTKAQTIRDKQQLTSIQRTPKLHDGSHAPHFEQCMTLSTNSPFEHQEPASGGTHDTVPGDYSWLDNMTLDELDSMSWSPWDILLDDLHSAEALPG